MLSEAISMVIKDYKGSMEAPTKAVRGWSSVLVLFALLRTTASNQVEPHFCPLSCSLNGECHRLYESPDLPEDTSAFYLCECFEGFAGYACEKCSSSHFGAQCNKCPSAKGQVCAGRGLCDDGKTGTGACLCRGSFTAESHCVEELTFEEKEIAATTTVTLLLTAAILCVLMVYTFIRFPGMKYLPDCVASILLGIAMGCSLLVYNPALTFTDATFFDPQAFFLLILPPIMFDAGYHTDKSNFVKNLGTIFAFAVLGTVIAAMVFAMVVYLGQMMLAAPHLTLTECLMFGSLISSVDPVATLAVFKAIKVDTVLQMIVFGESSLNDAVSIALFRTFSSFKTEGTELRAVDSVILFMYEFFGSIGVGVGIGFMSALLFKHINLKERPTFETAMFVLWSYIPFVLCEAIGLSGILGILFVAMMMVHYTHHSLSRVSQISTRQLYRSLGFLAETCAFVNLGLTLPFMQSNIRWSFVSVSIFALILSRTSSVFPTGFLCNLFRYRQISYSHMTIIWWSGIRGAVSFALALNFPTGHHDIVISTTMMLALFTILVQGGGTRPVLAFMNMNVSGLVMSKHGYLVDADYEEEEATPTGQRMFAWLSDFDRYYLQRWFRRVELLDDLHSSDHKP